MASQNSTERRGLLAIRLVIGVRVVLAGLFWLAFSRQLWCWSLFFVVAAFWTDILDGRLSRRYGVSAAGGYWDAIADFLFITTVFSLFVCAGLYPWWMLALTSAMFAQFVVSSGIKQPTYDPVGKYYGIFLFLASGATLLYPQPVLCRAVLMALVGLSAATLTSRGLLFYRRHRRGKDYVND